MKISTIAHLILICSLLTLIAFSYSTVYSEGEACHSSSEKNCGNVQGCFVYNTICTGFKHYGRGTTVYDSLTNGNNIYTGVEVQCRASKPCKNINGVCDIDKDAPDNTGTSYHMDFTFQSRC